MANQYQTDKELTMQQRVGADQYVHCSKCNNPTARDIEDVFERCLSCGWHRRITDADKKFLRG